MIVTAGATNRSVFFYVVGDASHASPGDPITGLLFSDIETGGSASYSRAGAARVDLTLITLASASAAHSDGGFILVDDTNMPGVYRCDYPDAAFATGVDQVVLQLVIAAAKNAVAAPILVDIFDINVRDSVRAGMTALPNAAADAAGGLVISDAGGLDIDTVASNVAATVADTGTDGVALGSSTLSAIADAIWDEATAGHVAAGSFGAANPVIRSATAQSGTGTTITLDASASAVDDFYNNTYVYILSGTGALQGRFITNYVGSSKVATVDTWVTNPDATSVFVITPFGTLPGASAPTASQVADAVWDEASGDHIASGSFGQAVGSAILRTGTAQGGGVSTITLDASASATNDLYNYSIVRISAGTGAGQARQISDYVGSSKVATVSLAWATNPSSDSVFQIIALGVDAATIDAISDGVWDEQRDGHVAAGSFGERVLANVTQISGDTTAADNLEAYTDGTTPMPVNVTQISSDATAADNLEAYTDGTTPMPVNATQISGDATAADNLEAAFDGTGGVTIVADITGALSGAVGSVTGAVGSVTALGAQAKADVNAEVLDVLATDTVSQPAQGTPAAAVSMQVQLAYLYKAWRNRNAQTATEYRLYNDDATTVDHKATVSDDGTTFSKGEVATGP